MKRTTIPKITAGLLATLALTGQASAQSADALIDKLVEKGVLSVKEANDLRQEADKEFTKAYALKSGMPDWVTSLKFNGDVRGRYEGFYSDDNLVDRNRFRYRMRFGAVATLMDNFEVGMRLTSSDQKDKGFNGGDPISGNTTFTDNGSKKTVWIDQAYGRWNPSWGAAGASFTFGKMQNPFVNSDMVYDPDYSPEGLAAELRYDFTKEHTLKFNLGGFVLSELSGTERDPYLYGAQVRLDSKWTDKIKTTFGASVYSLSSEQNLKTTQVPDINRGNERDGTGALVNHYNPIVVDAALTYSLDSFPMYTGAFPITLAADGMHNPGAERRSSAVSAGLTFGKAGKKGGWEISYRYKYLEGDAWFEEFTDSDFGANYRVTTTRSSSTGYQAGTNVKGHVLKAVYSPADAFSIGLTYFLTELIDEPKDPKGFSSEIGRLQVDATWKF
jgi:hypothetical protein